MAKKEEAKHIVADVLYNSIFDINQALAEKANDPDYFSQTWKGEKLKTAEVTMILFLAEVITMGVQLTWVGVESGVIERVIKKVQTMLERLGLEPAEAKEIAEKGKQTALQMYLETPSA